MIHAREDKGSEHRNQKRENSADYLGRGRIGVGVFDGHETDDEDEQQAGNGGVDEEPCGLAVQVAQRFVVRDVSLVHHGVLKKVIADRIRRRLVSVTSFGECAYWLTLAVADFARWRWLE